MTTAHIQLPSDPVSPRCPVSGAASGPSTSCSLSTTPATSWAGPSFARGANVTAATSGLPGDA